MAEIWSWNIQSVAGSQMQWYSTRFLVKPIVPPSTTPQITLSSLLSTNQRPQLLVQITQVVPFNSGVCITILWHFASMAGIKCWMKRPLYIKQQTFCSPASLYIPEKSLQEFLPHCPMTEHHFPLLLALPPAVPVLCAKEKDVRWL